MSGIAGYINHNGVSPSTLLDDMSGLLKSEVYQQINNWYDEYLAVSLIHHGAINPEKQPVFNEDRTKCIVMYGEVFNNQEHKSQLMQKGHKFKHPHHNAEICLHLYEEKGDEAFKELDGSFCIMIYHLLSHELVLVNDRFLSHPLFYTYTKNGTLLFGTQMSSILKSSEICRKLNMGSVYEFFNFMQVLGTKTFYKDIHILPPASILRFKDNTLKLKTYWNMVYQEENCSEDYYVHELASSLIQSVEKCTKENYRYGLLLSGGLDSRMILAASKKNMVCFTFGDFENNEVNIAKRVAASKNCKHVFLKRKPDHYFQLIDQAVEIGDGMYGFVHAHCNGFSEMIRDECDILLHGYSIERFFRGTNLPYKKFSLLGHKLLSVLNNPSYKNLPHEIIHNHKSSLYYLNPNRLFQNRRMDDIEDVMACSIRHMLKEAESAAPNTLDRFIWLDTHYPTRSYAFLFEKSLRSFIYERNIAFDNNLLDLHLKMPVRMRSNSRLWKKALKEINFEMAIIPDANTGYSPFLPGLFEIILDISKDLLEKLHLFKLDPLPQPSFSHGSWPDWGNLMRYHRSLNKLIYSTINDPYSIDPELFNVQYINQIFTEFMNGKDAYKTFMVLILTFGIWYKKFVSNNA